MNIFRKIWQRSYMFVFYKFTYLMNWRVPQIIKGNNSIVEIPKKIKELGLDDCFLVLDPGIEKLGLANSLIKSFDDEKIKYTIFDVIEPNPKIKDIELGVIKFKESNSKCICVIGGGSAMDTAKAIGARIARKNKSVEQLGGLLKVGKKIPTLFAIPTTAGTGSETTVAAVVTNEVTHHKYAINDLHLIPSYAVLDPTLTVGLPKSITSATGMDALTHAVEGYLCCDVPRKYKILAEEAVKTIIENILEVYYHGENLKAREAMLEASFKAGAVFTRVGLTYVHPIAHTLGGLYSVPHGLANAVVLPHCLKYYGSKVYKKLAKLADISGISNEKTITDKEKAEAFINKIILLDDEMGLTRKFDIKEEDIKTMIKWAEHEANSAYFPPVLLSSKDIENIIREIKA